MAVVHRVRLLLVTLISSQLHTLLVTFLVVVESKRPYRGPIIGMRRCGLGVSEHFKGRSKCTNAPGWSHTHGGLSPIRWSLPMSLMHGSPQGGIGTVSLDQAATNCRPWPQNRHQCGSAPPQSLPFATAVPSRTCLIARSGRQQNRVNLVGAEILGDGRNLPIIVDRRSGMEPVIFCR